MCGGVFLCLCVDSVRKVRSMNTELFWSLIESSRVVDSDECSARTLKRSLEVLSEDELIEFCRLFYFYTRRVNGYRILGAGSLLKGSDLSDDGRGDFAAWLVSRGRKIYEQAMDDPDSLAEIPEEMVEDSHVAFEHFSTAPWEVLEGKFGSRVFEYSKVSGFPEDDFPAFYSDAELRDVLPKLYAKYGPHNRVYAEVRPAELANSVDFIAGMLDGNIKEIHPKLQLSEIEVDGLGTVKVGALLIHRNYGKGRVVQLADYTRVPVARIEFQDGVRGLVLRRSVFSIGGVD